MTGWIVGGVLGVALLGLAAEAVLLHMLRARIPLRIAVGGTRGKSSTVRLIAVGLTAGGYRVTFKTTGSTPMLGLPTGEERPVRRLGLPSPLEQRRLLWAAVRTESTALVAEAMSIRPESLRTELCRILHPHMVVITNIREDHTSDLDDPDWAFADAIPLAAMAVCPATIPARFRERLGGKPKRSGKLVLVDMRIQEHSLESPSYVEWPENIALAREICRQAGVENETARCAMAYAHPDVGAFRAWRWTAKQGDFLLVNGFAANDPESTQLLLDRAKARWPTDSCVGVLNLRRDRGDRTIQWIRTFTEGPWPFDRLVLIGDVPLFTVRSLRRRGGRHVTVLLDRCPDVLLDRILADTPARSMVFGFGNIKGAGLRLVELWQEGGLPI